MKPVFAVIGAGLILAAGLAQAQEMRCNQVFMNASEERICSSEDLLRLDREMAQAYRRAEPHMPKIKKAQRAFKRGLKSCKGDDACLVRSYELRNDELRSFINTLEPPTEDVAIALGEEADAAVAEQEAEIAAVEAAEPAEIVLPEVATPDEEPVPELMVEAAPQPTPVAPAPMKKEVNWVILGVVVLVVIGALSMFWSWLKAVVRRCPRCTKWWAGVELDRDEQHSTEYRTVDRVKEHRNRHNVRTGSTTYQEQEAVSVVHAKHYMKCSVCGNRWVAYSSRRT